MRYCIAKVSESGVVLDKFGDYSDKREVQNSIELLNMVDPFNYYKVEEMI